MRKARSGKYSLGYLQREEDAFKRLLEFFSPKRRVASITDADISRYVAHRQRQKTHLGKQVANSTIRNELHSLSNLLKRALKQRIIQFNPVSNHEDKPGAKPTAEAVWLDVAEAASLIEAATEVAKRSVSYLHALIATFLLTGGRKREVLALRVEDVDFEARRVSFRPNQWRGLKSLQSRRSVPLWPQLADILRAELETSPRTGLLFPSRRPGAPKPLRGISDALQSCLRRAGIEKGITLHSLRHTYAAARIQTVDRGPNGELVAVAM